METEIKAGDKVHLISGGPIMTVHSVKVDEVTCEWFDKEHKFYSRDFKLSSLKIHEYQPIRVGKNTRNSFW